MARGAHVGIDPTMSSVCPTSHVAGSVHSYVGNAHLLHIQTLELGIGLNVGQHIKAISGTLGWLCAQLRET